MNILELKLLLFTVKHFYCAKIYIFAPHSNYIAKFINAKIKIILFHTIAFT